MNLSATIPDTLQGVYKTKVSSNVGDVEFIRYYMKISKKPNWRFEFYSEKSNCKKTPWTCKEHGQWTDPAPKEDYQVKNKVSTYEKTGVVELGRLSAVTDLNVENGIHNEDLDMFVVYHKSKYDFDKTINKVELVTGQLEDDTIVLDKHWIGKEYEKLPVDDVSAPFCCRYED
mmetsp:Transcript_40324/g.61994  ORF Transcript_40324/g.61994 Transcript_40324/m.61994 type:complete len:173 (-) Transcript_40324:43-561(-)